MRALALRSGLTRGRHDAIRCALAVPLASLGDALEVPSDEGPAGYEQALWPGGLCVG